MQPTGIIYKYPKLILFLVVFVLYGNTIKNGYAIDDNCVTGTDCITAKGMKAIPQIFSSFYTDKSEKNTFEYRPLVKVSFAIEHQLFGVKPSVSHLLNIIIYFFCLLVLWQWFKLVFSKYPAAFTFWIVVLFAMMPIHTEVVANIKNRDTLLCFLFINIGATQFFKSVLNSKGKTIGIVLCVLCLYLAFLSKADVIPFLAIIPAIALIEFKAKVKWVIGFIIIFIASYMVFRVTKGVGLHGLHAVRTNLYFENPLFFESGFYLRIISLFNCLGFYVLQIILPLKQSSYYGYDTIPVTEFSFFYGTLGVLFSGLILYGLIWSYRKKETAIFCGLFIFSACISMYLNLIIPVVGIVADRFCFTASLGMAVFILAAYQKWNNKKLNFAAKEKGIALIITVFFAIIIIQRNSEWKDLATLINADVKKYPGSVFLNYKQGANIIKSIEARTNSQLKQENQKQVAEAKAHFEKALAVYPDYPEALNYLSYVLVFLYNDFATALPYVNRSLGIEHSTEVLYYKGICYRELKNRDSCEKILLRCIRHDVNYQNAYDLLVYDYNANKQFAKSISLLENAIAKGVKNERINKMLDNAYVAAKDTSSAKTNPVK